MRTKVFISHSSNDHPFVERLVERLNADGIETWLDDADIALGESIPAAIEKGLSESQYFVAILSKSSVASDWVKTELNVAINKLIKKEIVIIPVLLDITADEMPALISFLKGITFSESNWDACYSELKKVILNKNESYALRKYKKSYLENIVLLDGIINNHAPSIEQVEFVLKLLKDKVYERYFLKRVRVSHWYDLLSEKNFFDPKRVPPPVPTGDSHYSIPEWDVLGYLEEISKQLPTFAPEDRAKYEDELVSIIKSVSRARKEVCEKDPQALSMDNFRTWYSFAKILQNIPEVKIDTELIGYFDFWLRSKFDTVLPSSEIGNKLLPRFVDSGDYAKAEQVSKILLGYDLVKPAREFSLFEDERKIVSRVDKYWLADIFIKHKTAFSLGRKCSPEFVLWLSAELRRMLAARYSRRFDFEAPDGKPYSVVLRMEDVNTISGYSISGRQHSRDNEADVFGRGDKLQKIVEVAETTMFPSSDAFKNYLASAFGRHLNINVDGKELGAFYDSLSADHSSVWIESLYDNFRNGYEDALSVYVFILRDILAGKVEADPVNAKSILRELWGDNFRYPVFKRLVLYCLGRYFDSYSDDFFKYYLNGPVVNLLNEPNLTPEVFKLLQLNATKFTEAELNQIEAVVSMGPKIDDETPHAEMQIKFWQQQWYTALKELPKYADYSEKLKAETKHDINIPRRVVTWSGPGGSPLSKEELLVKSNKEIAEFIPEFAAKKRDFLARITDEGLAETLLAATRENPEKFVSDLLPFLNLPYRYVYSLLDGILEAYKSGKSNLDWGSIWAFISSYIDRDLFWGDKLQSGDSELRRANHEWIVGKVAELIKYATHADETAIEAKYNSQMQEILFVFIKHLSREYADENKDPIFHFLNSTEGKTTEALLNLSLRCARLNQKEGKTPIWNADLKAKYEELLKDKIYDAYTVLGEYLPNFNYLDKLWVQARVKEFERLEDKAWFTFIVGYLYSPKVYDDLYAMMRQHYVRALSYDFGTSRAQELLSQHIAVGYLRSQDNLGGAGLINQFLETAKPEAIERFIGFIWMQRIKRDEVRLGETPEQAESKKRWVQVITPRIIELWAYVYENYQKTQKWGKGFEKVNSELVNLSVFLPGLNEVNLKWILSAIPCLEAFMGATFLIEYLNSLKDKGDLRANAKYLADIWNEMLKKFAPDYDIENVQAILSFIKKHQPELAKPIYDRYVELGREDVVKSL